MGLKRYTKKVGKAVKGAAKKVGHFTPVGQAYQLFRGAKEGGLRGMIGKLNPVRALSGDIGGLLGRKQKGIESGAPEAPREAAARKLIRKPVKQQAGAGQISYTAEYEE